MNEYFQRCRALIDNHDVAMLDLDGVVYISGKAIPSAPAAITAARAAGLVIGFVTNNASRTPDTVADKLTKLGVAATAGDVVSSAQAAARLLVERYGAGACVAVLGGRGLQVAITELGLRSAPVTDSTVVAVVTGYGPEVLWKDIMAAATRIRGGLAWVATNTDASIPTDYGIAPGHGVMVKMLSDFSGVTPTVAGKPSPPLLQETIRRLKATKPIMVGDRLDTDIEGARAIGIPSLLVMTGVSKFRDLFLAPPHLRPSYVAEDLFGLVESHPEVTQVAAGADCGGWRATVREGVLEILGSGARADWWRAGAAAAWRFADERQQLPRLSEQMLEPVSAAK